MNAAKIIDFVRSVVKGYTLHHRDLRVSVIEPAGSIERIVSIAGNPADKVRLVGKKGKNFKALTGLLNLFAKRNSVRIRLLHLELEPVPPGDRYAKFEVRAGWPVESLRTLAGSLANACLETRAVMVNIEPLTKADSLVTIRLTPQTGAQADLQAFREAAEVLLGANAAAMGQRITLVIADDLRFGT